MCGLTPEAARQKLLPRQQISRWLLALSHIPWLIAIALSFRLLGKQFSSWVIFGSISLFIAYVLCEIVMTYLLPRKWPRREFASIILSVVTTFCGVVLASLIAVFFDGS